MNKQTIARAFLSNEITMREALTAMWMCRVMQNTIDDDDEEGQKIFDFQFLRGKIWKRVVNSK